MAPWPNGKSRGLGQGREGGKAAGSILEPELGKTGQTLTNCQGLAIRQGLRVVNQLTFDREVLNFLMLMEFSKLLKILASLKLLSELEF